MAEAVASGGDQLLEFLYGNPVVEQLETLSSVNLVICGSMLMA